MSIDKFTSISAKSYLYAGKEEWWVRHQPFILSHGYKLRPRYEPSWVPSWSQGTKGSGAKITYDHTDLDAIRLSTGENVVLKRVVTNEDELKIVLLLDSPRLREDPRNRTIPILEVITVPNENWTLLVMPYCRGFHDPPFHCPAEVVEALQQYLEGLQFMHDNNISHFDIAPQNLMMDEKRVVPSGSHFFRPRTHTGFRGLFCWTDRCLVGPVDYYYLDFGLSMYFPRGSPARTTGGLRTFPTIPELSGTKPYDPFKVDIYQLGLTIEQLIKAYPALFPFAPVVTAMMDPAPAARPAPAESLARLNTIAARMGPKKLGRAMWKKNGFKDHITRKLLGGYYPNTPNLSIHGTPIKLP
ncbi:kinase-like domain-containing protein [Mycena rebaudengoi]|nr:kinase-like domain-containing protein [Mycena rebaudengoi]